MPDAEHRVVYKAFADFTALYAEVAKAKAAMAALRRDQGSTNVDRSKDINQQRELNKVTREHTTAVDNDAKAAFADIKNTKQLAEAAQKLREELAKLNAERRQATAGTAGIGPAPAWTPPWERRPTTSPRQTTAVANDPAGRVASDALVLREHAQAQDDAGKATDRSIDRSRSYQRAFKDQMGVLREKRGVLREHARTHDETGQAVSRSTTRSREYSRALRDMSTTRFTVNTRGAAADLQNVGGFVDRFAARVRDAAKESGNFERRFASWGNVWKATMRTLRVDQLSQGIKDAVKDSDSAWSKMVALARTGMRKITSEVSSSGSGLGQRIAGIIQYPLRASAAASGGGGAGGAGGGGAGALDSFAAAGDRAAQSLAGFLKHLFTMRTLIAAAVAAAGPLVAVLGALGAAALGAGNVMVSLAGTLAAVPGLFAALASSVGVLATVMGPLSNVFQAYTAAQKESVAGARQQATAVAQAANTARQAELSYRAAIKAVGDAQYDAKRAQLDLNDARKQATRNLQDLRMELERASLNEESATLGVKRAMADYRKALADPNATLLDRQEALNRVQQAEFDLRDVQQKNIRNQTDYNEAQKKGVEGSDEVVAAQKRIADANFALIQSQQRVIDASIDLKKARKDEAAGGAQANTAQQAYLDLLDRLSPSTRKFVLAILGLKDRWHELQNAVSERLFAPIIGQLGKFPGLLNTLQTLLGSAAGAMGNLAAKGIAMVASGPWKRDFATLAQGNVAIITNLGNAGLYVADAFRNIAVAAQPFTTWLTGAIARAAAAFDDWSKAARHSGDIAAFLNDTKDRLKIVWDIAKNVLSFFGSLYVATKDIGDYVLSALDKMTGRWAALGKAQEKQGSGLRTWLQEVKPLLSVVGHFIGQIAGAFATLASDPHNIAEAKRILGILADDILPKIVSLFTKLAEHGVIGDILTAVGNGLDAINAAIDRTKGLPLDIIVWFLQQAGLFLKWAFQNPIVGTIIAGWAIGMAAFIGAAALGKLTGIFKLWDFLRWVINNKKAFTLGGILDKSFGAGESGTGGKKTGGGVVRAGAGVAAEEGAAGALKGSALALDRAAEALIAAAAALRGAAELTAGADLLGGVPGGKGKAKGAARAVAGEADDVAKAAGKGNWFSRLFGRGAGKEGAEAAAKAGARGGLRGGALFDPLAWGGLALGMVADSGLLGKRGSTGKQLGQAGGAIATGAGVGALAGSIVPIVGTAAGAGVGALAGLVYSLVKDKGLRDKIGGFFAGIGHWFVDVGKSVGGWVNKNVIRPVTGFFGAIFTAIGHFIKAPATWVWEKFIHPILAIFLGLNDAIAYGIVQSAKWVYRYILTPLGHFFSAIGSAIGSGAGSAGKWVYDHLLVPIGRYFAALGSAIGSGAGGAGRWMNQYVLTPLGRYFAALGSAVASGVGSAGKWVYDRLLTPVGHFFSAIGSFLVNLPSAVERWAESIPGIGRFIKGAFNALPGAKHDSGGFVTGTYDGRSDTKNTWLTVGEHVTRKRVADKPGAKQLLDALNNEQIEPQQLLAALGASKTAGRWMDPSVLYAGLGAASRPVGAAARIPAARAPSATHVVHDNSKHSGLSTGDITINNPVREASTRSLRRTLHASAYMLNR